MILKLPVRDLFVNFKCIAILTKTNMILSVCKESCRLLQSDFFLTTQHGSKLPSHIYCAIYFLSRYKIYIYLYRIYPLVFVFYHCPCKICWFCWFITEMGRSQHRGRNRRWEKDQLQNQGANAGSHVWTFWSILASVCLIIL